MIDHQAISEQVNREFTCNCTLKILTYKIAANGVKHYRKQCTRCGKHVPQKRSDYTAEQLESAVSFDDEIWQIWWKRRSERQQELAQQTQDQQNYEWWKWYTQYLSSEQWKSKRQRTLERDGHKCQACLRNQATQVHHLTYERVGDEPLFDLVSVCDHCHEKLHRRTA